MGTNSYGSFLYGTVKHKILKTLYMSIEPLKVPLLEKNSKYL